MKTLYYFTAPWCGPCRQAAPSIQKLKDEFAEKVEFIKVDVDEHRAQAVEAGIGSVPTFHLHNDGEKVREMIGFRGEAALREMLSQ